MPSAAAEHFSRLATRYSEIREAWPQRILRRQEEEAVHALVRIEPGARVLDVGCGDGRMLEWLRQCGARVAGLDVAWSMAQCCHRRGFPVAVQDMEHLGVRACFDWVLCIGSLEFTRDPGRVIESFANCLRPGGRLALLFPQRHWLGRLYAAYHRTHGVPIGLFSRTDIVGWLEAAGLRQQDGMTGTLSALCIAERPAHARSSAAGP